MDIEKLWDKAQEKTEVIRGRVKALATFMHTPVPYIFLAESSVNEGHTVIRKGKVIVEKPMIVLPEDMPQFEGFDFSEEMDIEGDSVQMFFLMRGIRFPSLKYNNSVEQLDLEEAPLSKSIDKHKKQLEKEENVSTALVIGPEDCWQFSILLYLASLVGRCTRADIINLLNKMYRED
ncbi:MAG: hypothetical protein ACE5JK_06150 [Candidatus Omnitrophota bacterium]